MYSVQCTIFLNLHGHVQELRVWFEIQALQKLWEHCSVDGSFMTNWQIGHNKLVRMILSDDCMDALAFRLLTCSSSFSSCDCDCDCDCSISPLVLFIFSVILSLVFCLLSLLRLLLLLSLLLLVRPLLQISPDEDGILLPFDWSLAIAVCFRFIICMYRADVMMMRWWVMMC